MFNRLFNYLRGIRDTDIRKADFPNTYQVLVHVQHPNIGGSILKFYITIDAHDKAHAIKRIGEEVKIKCGNPRRIK